jgi:STE24 endopeptidase
VRAFILQFLLIAVFAASASCSVSAAAHNPSGAEFSEQSLPQVTHYSLPPDKLAKARALYNIQVWLYLASTVYFLAILLLFLERRWVVRLRELGERASRSQLVQAAVIIPSFAAALSALMLPLTLYGHYVSLRYGLSVQGWPSFFRDWALQLLLICLLSIFVGWILFLVLRRNPRRGWFYFWLAVIPITAFLTFISPVVIDPLFNEFQPLDANRPQLVTALEKVIEQAGLQIPRSRMYEMKASQKLTGSNAYVTGFGATKRVVVWDTAIQKMSTEEIQFVFGHELGHYVLGHVVKGFAFAMAFCLLLFYLTFQIADFALRRWGAKLGIRSMDDWASLPLLVLIVVALMFVSSPLLNGFSRYLEHQADIYGLELVHGLVPNASEVAAASFQQLGEEWLDYPYANRAAIVWLWDHPSIPDRIHFALTYDPWKHGQAPQFVKRAPPGP